jgi:hypothetical protein
MFGFSRSTTLLAGLACLTVSLMLTSTASAAPITVNLRVEGSAGTLYEGPISTEAVGLPGFTTTSSPEAHPCDVSHNGGNEGFATSGANATTALRDGALASGLAFDAKWFSSFNDFEVNKVGPDTNGGEAEGFPSWGYAVNYTTANVGGCQFQLAPGNEVLWAYNYFNLPHLLSLTGPASVGTGSPFTVHVVDGRTGEAIAGATIGTLSGGVTTPLQSATRTDATGNATVTLTTAGPVALKATEPSSVRSNGLTVCAHTGNDGTCGTVAPGETPHSLPAIGKAPAPATGLTASVLGLKTGRVFSRRSAPRLLSGVVKVASGGTLHSVRIRLQRRVGRICFNFSGSRERFVRAPKCAAAAFFSVGSSESFSYLLPSRLPTGRYTYDIDAVEGSGHVTGLVGGVSHVVFRVK